MREFLMREFAEGVDQEEYRSSGVQEFRKISELGTLLRIGATERTFGERSGFDLAEISLSAQPKVEPEQGFQAPTEPSSVAPFQAGSESLSERHSFLLNSSILNSFQGLSPSQARYQNPPKP
jgi:hypothetical protein